jgi:DNA-binding Lrp family transcriptional regulator
MRRKITDDVLTQWMVRIDSGEITQKDLAAQLGVSPSALNQRIKRLKSYALPESFKALTDKQKLFALAKVEGKSNLDAVKSAYDVTSSESGKALGTQLMKDPDIGAAIQDLMAQEGITRRRRVQRLRDMIDCPDLSVAGKGLDMSFKLAGDYAPQQIETVTEVEVRALVATIIADIDRRPDVANPVEAEKAD